ncbi:hypothetical protein PF005_g19062 [Phytophthora fragariae]|uniref:Secreted protein n=1 Tax=Phytophthora fragariae TaxID=53985 RepID=A0A6A3X0V4_9STRA|nr:hypothetical protein PF009_g20013 [Phytophthora fragariae]KAE9006451.1 hypothetical protein PF011_g11576 [Phytophthora fragariae]KAE9082731.1 hypothetical protein PF010_g21469 [Phytophthora fragariae]KAE9090445.1 hypothetical protein PF007_g19240 [Phytophthora fragariae]KAE9105604.1 hypothetical protein PF006_g21603 [Phytophthora fragariae]
MRFVASAICVAKLSCWASMNCMRCSMVTVLFDDMGSNGGVGLEGEGGSKDVMLDGGVSLTAWCLGSWAWTQVLLCNRLQK